MIFLNKLFIYFIISMNLFIIFLVSREYMKNCHCDIHIRSPWCANTQWTHFQPLSNFSIVLNVQDTKVGAKVLKGFEKIHIFVL